MYTEINASSARNFIPLLYPLHLYWYLLPYPHVFLSISCPQTHTLSYFMFIYLFLPPSIALFFPLSPFHLAMYLPLSLILHLSISPTNIHIISPCLSISPSLSLYLSLFLSLFLLSLCLPVYLSSILLSSLPISSSPFALPLSLHLSLFTCISSYLPLSSPPTPSLYISKKLKYFNIKRLCLFYFYFFDVIQQLRFLYNTYLKMQDFKCVVNSPGRKMILSM